MKNFILIMAMTITLVSCGGSGSSKKQESEKPDQERITQSVNSIEGQLLVSNNWCADFDSIDDNDNEYLAQWRWNFLKTGDYSFTIKNLGSNQIEESIKGFWTLNSSGTKMTISSAAEVVELSFSVTQAALTIDFEFEDETGSTMTVPFDFIPCM